MNEKTKFEKYEKWAAEFDYRAIDSLQRFEMYLVYMAKQAKEKDCTDA